MSIRSLLRTSLLVAPALLLAQPAMAAGQPPVPPPLPPPPPMQGSPPPARAPVPGEMNMQGNIQVCETARGEQRMRLEAGRRYTITATSEAFDTVLRILRPGNEEVLAENDDYGEGLNSRVVFAPTESGEYVARVASFSPGGVGAYQLRVTPAGPLPALVSRPTSTERAQWRVYQGTLAASDAAEDNKHYDDYELRLAAGQTAMIHVDSGEIDTVLRVYNANARGGTTLAENDDGGGGTNPFVFFAPEQAGTYVVRVTSFGENATGPYRLRISQ